MGIPTARTLQVVVGGVNGYADLGVASNFTDGTSTGRLGLYTHGNGVIDEGQGGVNATIGQAWAAQGPGVAEFGIYPAGFFAAAASYQAYWVNSGIAVAEANVDCSFETPKFLSSFEAFVNEGRTVGHIQNFAPIFSPNSSSLYDGTQASLGTGLFDPKWAVERAAAVYGGGLAFDTPPLFTFYSPPWYFDFVAEEIRWGNSLGLRTSVIVSPYAGETDYLGDAQKFEGMLVAAHAVPTQWVIESYAQNANGTYPTDGSFPNPIGSEKTPNTEAAVADWFAHNAPTAVLDPDTTTWTTKVVNGALVPVQVTTKGDGGWRIQNPDGSFGVSVTGSASGTSLAETAADGSKTYYSYTTGGALTGSRSAPGPGAAPAATSASSDATFVSPSAISAAVTPRAASFSGGAAAGARAGATSATAPAGTAATGAGRAELNGAYSANQTNHLGASIKRPLWAGADDRAWAGHAGLDHGAAAHEAMQAIMRSAS